MNAADRSRSAAKPSGGVVPAGGDLHQPRERSVPCVFCGRRTWNLQPVCNAVKCQQAERRATARIAARRTKVAVTPHGAAAGAHRPPTPAAIPLGSARG